MTTEQNGRHFAEEIFQIFYLIYNSIEIYSWGYSLEVIRVMTWCRIVAKS